ncbi:hypothetical protein CUMW_146150 [Citrus unshiu]|nr:hypothetical protein CUMW_146150 [Citrus unshiu]
MANFQSSDQYLDRPSGRDREIQPGHVCRSSRVCGSTSLPPHPLTKRHTAPLGQVVAAGICFAGTITGARIDARVVAARIVFAGSVTGIFFARSVTGTGVGARIRWQKYMPGLDPDHTRALLFGPGIKLG